MYKYLAFIVGFIVLLSGCQNTSSSDVSSISTISSNSSSTSSVSTFGTFQIPTVAKEISEVHFSGAIPSLSREKFLEKIYRSNDFYDKKDEEYSLEQLCIKEKLDLYVYEQLKDNTYMLDSGVIDLFSCTSDENFELFSANIYNTNILLRDENNISISPNDFDENLLSSMSFASKHGLSMLKYLYNSEVGELNYSVLISKTGLQGFETPCIMKSGKSECITSSVKYAELDGVTKKMEYTVFVDETLSKNGRYYDSGKITFFIDDWIGVMTYTDKDTAPTYRASNAMEYLKGVFLEEPTVSYEDGNTTYTKTITEDGGFILDFKFEQGFLTHYSYVLLNDANDEIIEMNDILIEENETLTCKPINDSFTCRFINGSEVVLNLSPYLYLKKWTTRINMKKQEGWVLETISTDGIVEGLKE